MLQLDIDCKLLLSLVCKLHLLADLHALLTHLLSLGTQPSNPSSMLMSDMQMMQLPFSTDARVG